MTARNTETLAQRAEEALDRYAEECRRHEITRKDREALAAANAQLERERDEARLRAAEGVVAVNKFDRERMAEARLRYSMEKERDAAIARAEAAEGERDRLREALQSIRKTVKTAPGAGQYSTLSCVDSLAEAALTPEAPRDE